MAASFGNNDEVYRFESFTVAAEGRLVQKAGRVVRVRPQVFDLLLILLRNAGRTVPKAELLREIWRGTSVTEGSLTQLVRELRETLEDQAASPRYISTQSKHGYSFIAPLQQGRPRPETNLEKKHWQLTTHSPEASIVAAAISPDGRHLAYADGAGVYLKLIESGETQPLRSLRDWQVAGLAWFPDSTRLLVSGRAGQEENAPQIRAVSIVMDAVSWSIAHYAGDVATVVEGSRIALISGNGQEVWLMKPDEDPHRVFAGEDGDKLANVAVLPGERLLFSRLRIGEYEFEVRLECLNLDTGRVTTVLSDPRLRGYCISRDGRLIYALADAAPRQSDVNLWEARLDVSTGDVLGRPRQLTNWSGSNLYALSTSHDGKRVCFLKGPYQADVVVGELSGEGASLKSPRRLTLDDRNDLPTAWTPDSKAVLFHSDRNGKWEIFKQDSNERTAELFITGPQDCRGARVSADGWVFYSSRNRDRMWSWTEPLTLMRIPLAGGSPSVVVSARRLYSVRCARAPSHLCVLGERKLKQFVFYALDPVRGKRTELARTEVNLPLDLSHWDLSPDGSRIALVAERAGRIRVLNLADGATRDMKCQWMEQLSVDGLGRRWKRVLRLKSVRNAQHPPLYRHARGSARPARTAGQFPDLGYTFSQRRAPRSLGMVRRQQRLDDRELLIP
jgi:DNA-binding winged helix-turn-helix (wHTH) protein